MKKLICAVHTGVLTMLVHCVFLQEALAQSAGGGGAVEERVGAISKGLGGILGVVFVILMIRSFLKKK